MKLESAKDLKEQFKREFARTHVTSATASRLEALAGRNWYAVSAALLNPEQRLSIGYARVEGRRADFRVEMRIQRKNGLAHRAAEAFKEQAKGEANIEVIPRIEIPSIALVGDSSRSAGKATRVNPLQLGVSVSHRDGPTGTLGGFVELKEGDGILSNCHVLALSGSAEAKKDHIFHPGSEDTSILKTSMRIAVLHEFSEFREKQANIVDAAIAVLMAGCNHDGTRIPKTSGHKKAGSALGKIVSIGELGPSQIVAKIGRTTGYTTGKVNAISLDNVPVEVPGIGIVSFSNVVEVRSISADQPFTLPGDSGSIVFTDAGLAPFGLHFAGEYKTLGQSRLKVSYACSLDTVLDTLEATWIT